MNKEKLEAQCRKTGKMIGDVLPEGVGFVFLLFDFGEGGNMAYMSNAVRQDMIATLRELVIALEGN